jgi:hypothetical protein
LEEKQI